MNISCRLEWEKLPVFIVLIALTAACAAEIVVIDLKKEWKVSEDDFKSKSSNSGFIDETLDSRVVYTIAGKNCFINK